MIYLMIFSNYDIISTMRQTLECLLLYSPGCMNQANINTNQVYSGPQGQPQVSSSQINDVNWRAKQYLDRNCDQNGGWRSLPCFMRPDLRTCEQQLTGISSQQACG